LLIFVKFLRVHLKPRFFLPSLLSYTLKVSPKGSPLRTPSVPSVYGLLISRVRSSPFSMFGRAILFPREGNGAAADKDRSSGSILENMFPSSDRRIVRLRVYDFSSCWLLLPAFPQQVFSISLQFFRCLLELKPAFLPFRVVRLFDLPAVSSIVLSSLEGRMPIVYTTFRREASSSICF